MKSSDLAEVLDLADELMERRDGARAAAAFERALSLPSMPDDERAWTLYQKADALRIASRWEEAESQLELGAVAAAQISDHATAERLSLLRYQIARDRGDCREERKALERFLHSHPQSQLRNLARETLEKLDRSEDSQCS